MKIVFTPDWFLGSDVLINLFSFLVLAAFFAISLKCYSLSKKKKGLYLGIGFLLIALAQLANILTKSFLYYDTSFTQTIGQAVITYEVVKSVDIFYHIGFFWYKLLTLMGLFAIYKLPLEGKTKKDFLLMLYLLIISTFLSASQYYVFHLTALILIAFIIRNYSVVYLKNKNKNTELLIFGFYGLALSQAIFTFSSFGPLYVTADIIELISYFTLLIVIKRILSSTKSINR